MLEVKFTNGYRGLHIFVLFLSLKVIKINWYFLFLSGKLEGERIFHTPPEFCRGMACMCTISCVNFCCWILLNFKCTNTICLQHSDWYFPIVILQVLKRICIFSFLFPGYSGLKQICRILPQNFYIMKKLYHGVKLV